ncbi:MAG TPA: hypothetical protein VJU61_27160 [Polyangiaceae bacterium]|nr:hypothetical protein [Polyangiaceae bacterium]
MMHTRVGVGLGLLLGTLACGGRDASWSEPLSDTETVGLRHAVVLGDDPLERVMVLKSDGVGQLQRTLLPVGQHRVKMLPDVSGEQLLVLSSGIQPRLEADDELPSLSLLDTRGTPSVAARYPLSAPFSNLTLDPAGQWVVLSGAAENLVTNPNQLVLIDLTDPDFEPFTKTIRSFGAAPVRFQFSTELDVPGGARRFLIVETLQDVTLVDLEDLTRSEVTIGLPRTPAGAAGKPLEVVVHPGLDDVPNDARLAIRLENDPNLVLVNFTPTESDDTQFNLTLNLVDVGAPPSALDFVATDGGLRLAALVPGRLEAALVHPDTTRVEHLDLPQRFDRLRKVGSGAVPSGDSDVALLWGQNQNSVAVWSLGRTDAQAFRSIDVLNLDARVAQVFDVPGDTYGRRKLLQADDSRFFVLDLERRQSFPMLSSGSLSLSVADDGLRAWAFAVGSPRLAKIDLSTLEPTNLQIERPLAAVFDIASSTGGGRTLVALHGGGGRSATLLNALEPDSASTRFYPALLLGGQP